jgi:hypothetical protein
LKNKSYKEKETLKERGTKRFQERLAEEKEAEKEIKQFDPSTDHAEEDCIDNTNRPTFP